MYADFAWGLLKRETLVQVLAELQLASDRGWMKSRETPWLDQAWDYAKHQGVSEVEVQRAVMDLAVEYDHPEGFTVCDRCEEKVYEIAYPEGSEELEIFFGAYKNLCYACYHEEIENP